MKTCLLAIARLVAVCLLIMAGASIGGWYALSPPDADASRNSSGTMSPANGPYTSGQVISSSLINARFADIENELTSSADRSGRGGFLAPVRSVDGTVAAPALSFTSETGTGYFRNGTNDLRLSIGGTAKGFWGTTGLGILLAPAYPLDVAGASGTQARFGSTVTSGGLSINNRTGVDPRFQSNGVFDGVSDKYMQTGIAGMYQMPGAAVGAHVFYTAVSGTAGNAITFVEQARISASGLTISTGVAGDGSGFKHKQGTAGCTTAASDGALCATTVTWTTTFPDTNYAVACSGIGAGGCPAMGAVSAKNAGSVVVQTAAACALASGFSTIECIAVHD